MVDNLVGRFDALGLVPVLGFERELWIFEADAGRDLPLPTRLARVEALSDLVAEPARRMPPIGHPLTAVRSEAHAGFIEIFIAPGPALHAADGAARARRHLAELCAERDLIASLMAKPYGGREGAAGPVHASLERDGVDLFACRVMLRPDASARVEHRCGGADANPCISAAAVLAGGVDGLERGLDLPQPRVPGRRTVPPAGER